VTNILNFGGGRFALEFDTEPTVESAAAKVFPNGTPRGVTIGLYGPKRVVLEHITADVVAQMPEWLGRAFYQATQGIDEDPMKQAQKPAQRHGKPHPEIDIDTPEAAKAWLEKRAHETHEIADVAELIAILGKIVENIAYTRLVAQVGVDAAEGVTWAGAGISQVARFHRLAAVVEVLEVVSKVLAVFGDIALIIWVGYQLIEAFKEEKESQVRFGYLYGVMWEALDHSDHIREYRGGGMTYTPEELREAFVEGVAQGRAKTKGDIKIKNGLKIWIASVAVQEGIDANGATRKVLTDIYNKKQRSKLRFPLEYPTPMPYAGIAGVLMGE